MSAPTPFLVAEQHDRLIPNCSGPEPSTVIEAANDSDWRILGTLIERDILIRESWPLHSSSFQKTDMRVLGCERSFGCNDPVGH